MEKLGFCSEVSSLIFPFYSQEEKRCMCHYGVCPLAEESAAGNNAEPCGRSYIALAKTMYNGKRRNVTPGDFEALREAA